MKLRKAIADAIHLNLDKPLDEEQIKLVPDPVLLLAASSTTQKLRIVAASYEAFVSLCTYHSEICDELKTIISDQVVGTMRSGSSGIKENRDFLNKIQSIYSGNMAIINAEKMRRGELYEAREKSIIH